MFTPRRVSRIRLFPSNLIKIFGGNIFPVDFQNPQYGSHIIYQLFIVVYLNERITSQKITSFTQYLRFSSRNYRWLINSMRLSSVRKEVVINDSRIPTVQTQSLTLIVAFVLFDHPLRTVLVYQYIWTEKLDILHDTSF